MEWQANPEVRAEEIFRYEPSRPTRGGAVEVNPGGWPAGTKLRE